LVFAYSSSACAGLRGLAGTGMAEAMTGLVAKFDGACWVPQPRRLFFVESWIRKSLRGEGNFQIWNPQFGHLLCWIPFFIISVWIPLEAAIASWGFHGF
jgi:hypothetical protein